MESKKLSGMNIIARLYFSPSTGGGRGEALLKVDRNESYREVVFPSALTSALCPQTRL